MIVTYSKFHRWYKPAIDAPEKLFSDKNRKRINSSLPRFAADKSINYHFAKLDQHFLEWFSILYKTTIESRPNPVVHDIYEATLNNKESTSEYWSLTIQQGNTVLGGTIFGLRSDRLMIAYKAYQKHWTSGTFQANPTLYSEYLLSLFAYEQGKKLISHGKDRNPYGINASIGLATFKLSVGYTPSILEEHDDYTPLQIDTQLLTEEALILIHPKQGTEITKAVLCVPNNDHSYHQVTQYPTLLAVQTILQS